MPVLFSRCMGGEFKKSNGEKGIHVLIGFVERLDMDSLSTFSLLNMTWCASELRKLGAEASSAVFSSAPRIPPVSVVAGCPNSLLVAAQSCRVLDFFPLNLPFPSTQDIVGQY